MLTVGAPVYSVPLEMTVENIKVEQVNLATQAAPKDMNLKQQKYGTIKDFCKHLTKYVY